MGKPQDFAKDGEATTRPAMEAIQHLYDALLAVPPFTLKDGTAVQVAAYQPPHINDAGEAACGLDVKLPNGHLEFTMRNSGWGKSFMDEHGKQRDRKGRRSRQR